MEHSNLTQNQMILDYIEKHGSITPLEAQMDLGVMRLASRVSDLRKRGHNINSQMVAVQNRQGKKCRVKRYWVEEE